MDRKRSRLVGCPAVDLLRQVNTWAVYWLNVRREIGKDRRRDIGGGNIDGIGELEEMYGETGGVTKKMEVGGAEDD